MQLLPYDTLTLPTVDSLPTFLDKLATYIDPQTNTGDNFPSLKFSIVHTLVGHSSASVLAISAEGQLLVSGERFTESTGEFPALLLSSMRDNGDRSSPVASIKI